MKFLILICCFVSFSYSQIPDVGSQLQLKAINGQLREIVVQNNLGLKTQQTNLARMIDAARNTYQSYQQLQKLNDQKEKFLKDIKAIQKYRIDDLSELKNFVLHGDQIDFWFKSSSSNLINDIKRLDRFNRNSSELIGSTNTVLGLDKIDDNLKRIEEAEEDALESDMNYVTALPDLITLQIQMAERYKQLANDKSVSMSQADRAKLLLLAQELEDKTMTRFRELQDEQKKLVDRFKKTQNARLKNKIINDRIRKYLNSSSSNMSYGLFNSNGFNVKLLGDLKWGKNY